MAIIGPTDTPKDRDKMLQQGNTAILRKPTPHIPDIKTSIGNAIQPPAGAQIARTERNHE